MLSLSKLKALLDAATPGPWSAAECKRYGCNALSVQLEPYSSATDAQLVVAMQNCLPELLAVVEAAEVVCLESDCNQTWVHGGSGGRLGLSIATLNEKLKDI
jgi:hypothetical protein